MKNACLAEADEKIEIDDGSGIIHKKSPFAQAALVFAVASLCIALLMYLAIVVLYSGFEVYDDMGSLFVCMQLGGISLVSYVLAPLALLSILIGVVHKLWKGKESAAWGMLGISLVIASLSVACAYWAFSLMAIG
ncbi:hypothetical protein [Pontiella desulfatans]|nr:hypothetical protein [Pontiella desulfatans]